MNSFYRRKDREWVLGDRLCSCHFTDGRRDQLPTIVIVSPAQQLVLLRASESVLLICYDSTYLTTGCGKIKYPPKVFRCFISNRLEF